VDVALTSGFLAWLLRAWVPPWIVGTTRDKAKARPAAGGPADAAPTEEGTRAPAGWSRPVLTAARRWGLGPRTLAASAVVAGLLAAGAWHGTGAMVASDARQRVADRWAELRTCLLGNGLPPGSRPSQLLRGIELSATLAGDEATWPAVCIPYAKALDQALQSPAAMRELGVLPAATPLLASGPISARGAELNELYAAMEAAKLPLARGSRAVPQPPPPAEAILQRSDLSALDSTVDLRTIAMHFDPQGGKVLRLVLPTTPPQLCRFADGPHDQRWQRVACRALPAATAGLRAPRLARSEPGSADLVYQRDGGGKDGFFDAASGLRVWRPRDADAQAVVRKSGVTTVLYAEHRGDGSDREVTGHRLVQLRPGRAPSNRRLSVPEGAELLLLPQGLLWWAPTKRAPKTTLYGQVLRAAGSAETKRWLGPRKAIGKLPAGSRHVADCASGYSQAVLFATAADEPRYTLLFREQGMYQKLVPVGVLTGAPVLSCQGDLATLVRRRGNRVAAFTCTADGCQQAVTSPLPGLTDGVAAVAALGTKLALVWARPGEPTRLRIGSPDRLHQTSDVLLLDDASHGGLDPAAFRLASNGGAALLLVQTRAGQTYALRVDAETPAKPVTVVPW